LPKGVLNVVTGKSSVVGDVLTSHPAVRVVSFTGSTEVGKKLIVQCAGTVKKIYTELGGNAPFIVFDDADLDAAVEGVMISKFRNMGQTCVCANRIYVQAGVHDVFVEKLTAAVKKLKLGDGRIPGVTQGPLVNGKAVEKVEAHVADALAKGAKVATGGARSSLGGSFFEPTVLTGVTSAMAVAREETFGPLAPVFRFETEEEAIRLANDTEFGLASYFYARDVGRIFRVAEGLQAGMVGVNSGAISSELVPFGGVKESGNGREGSHHGIDEYVEKKYLLIAGLER
jgi:succinate-semialdehyde dehydrogenase/glutarate-semialdehyde dehydrogenase